MKDYDHFGSTPQAKKTKEKMTQEMVRARAAAIVHGTDPSAELHVVDEKIKQLVTRLQSWYRGHIVRRTIWSPTLITLSTFAPSIIPSPFASPDRAWRSTPIEWVT